MTVSSPMPPQQPWWRLMRKHRPTLPTVVAAAVVVACEQSALRQSPNRRHRAAGAWSTDLTSLIQRKLDRPVRRGGSEGPPRAPTVPVLSYSHMIFHMKMVFSRGLRPRLWKRVYAGPMAHMSGNISSQHHKETPRCPLCNSLASLTRLGSGVPRPPHMRIRPGSSFVVVTRSPNKV